MVPPHEGFDLQVVMETVRAGVGPPREAPTDPDPVVDLPGVEAGSLAERERVGLAPRDPGPLLLSSNQRVITGLIGDDPFPGERQFQLRHRAIVARDRFGPDGRTYVL